MAFTTQLPSVKHLSSAQLWIGPEHLLQKHIISYAQELFCEKKGCATCPTCTKIVQRQHHALHWIAPEKQYKIEHIIPMLETLSLKLDPHEHVFFIIQKGDLLTPLCANKLLKPLEEPPEGYHIIIFAQHADRILDTIQSRCITYTWHEKETDSTYKNFFSLLTASEIPELTFPAGRIVPQEQEIASFLDTLIAHWITQSHKALQSNNISAYHQAQKRVSVFVNATHHLPMPGGALLFWKNIIFALHEI